MVNLGSAYGYTAKASEDVGQFDDLSAACPSLVPAKWIFLGGSKGDKVRLSPVSSPVVAGFRLTSAAFLSV